MKPGVQLGVVHPHDGFDVSHGPHGSGGEVACFGLFCVAGGYLIMGSDIMR